MQLDQNPFFRKTIAPWYDSNFVCWALIALLSVVFAFAITGFVVGINTPQFIDHAWFPGFLAVLCFFVVIKIYFRLKRRAKNN
ncbi:MAG: hypothetical protein L3J69_07065 [Desulfobacula sp.]|nr:hypothetical protein [Desulfobacula sp.]